MDLLLGQTKDEMPNRLSPLLLSVGSYKPLPRDKTPCELAIAQSCPTPTQYSTAKQASPACL